MQAKGRPNASQTPAKRQPKFSLNAGKTQTKQTHLNRTSKTGLQRTLRTAVSTHLRAPHPAYPCQITHSYKSHSTKPPPQKIQSSVFVHHDKPTGKKKHIASIHCMQKINKKRKVHLTSVRASSAGPGRSIINERSI